MDNLALKVCLVLQGEFPSVKICLPFYRENVVSFMRFFHRTDHIFYYIFSNFILLSSYGLTASIRLFARSGRLDEAGLFAIGLMKSNKEQLLQEDSISLVQNDQLEPVQKVKKLIKILLFKI